MALGPASGGIDPIMARRWTLALALACLTASAPAGIRPGDGFELERARAASQLIAGLQSYADWCSSKKVWLERNRAMEAILSVDPGNMWAKRALGWIQVADGSLHRRCSTGFQSRS